MAIIQTIRLATAPGTELYDTGYVVRLPLGTGHERFLIHGHNRTMTHIATGFRVCDLGPMLLARFVMSGYMPPEQEAERRAARDTWAKYRREIGDEVLAGKLAALPVINVSASARKPA